jgi:hypothetical protein
VVLKVEHSAESPAFLDTHCPTSPKRFGKLTVKQGPRVSISNKFPGTLNTTSALRTMRKLISLGDPDFSSFG